MLQDTLSTRKDRKRERKGDPAKEKDRREGKKGERERPPFRRSVSYPANT